MSLAFDFIAVISNPNLEYLYNNKLTCRRDRTDEDYSTSGCEEYGFREEV